MILRCEIQYCSLAVKLSCWPDAHLAFPTGLVAVPTHLQRRQVGQTPLLPKFYAPSALHQSLLAHQQWRRRVPYRYLTLFVAVSHQEGSAWQGAGRTPFEARSGPQ